MKIFNKERRLTPSWDLLAPSMELVKKYIWHVMYLSFLPGLVLTVGIVLLGENPDNIDLNSSRASAGFSILLVAGLWSILTFPGFIYMQTKAVQGKEVGVMESFQKGLPRLLPLIGMMLVAAMLILLGLIAFIVPGLILIRGFYLAPYYVIDQQLGPIQALKRSYRETTPVSAWVWGAIGVELVFGIVASILGKIAVVGYLLSVAASYPYIFGSALRYGEVVKKIKMPVKV